MNYFREVKQTDKDRIQRSHIKSRLVKYKN